MADQLAQMYGVAEDEDALIRASLAGGLPTLAPTDSTGMPIDPAIADARMRGAAASRPSTYMTAPAREAAAVRAAAADATGQRIAEEEGFAPRPVAFDEGGEDAQIRAGLSPSQFDVAGVAGMRGGESDAEAAAIRSALMQGYNAPSAPNPLRPIREEYAGKMLGDGTPVTELDAQGNVVERASGLMGQEEFQTQQLHAAQTDEQRAHAGAYAQEAGRQQAQIDAMEYKAQQQQQRRDHAINASQLVQKKVTEAADRLNTAPDIDPNRYWASQSAGRKFAWGLQAGLMGFAGLDPFGALQSAISQDIDAQKANFAQKQAGMGARMDELSGARSVYGDIRQAIGDEQATDLMMESARLQQADAALKAMAIKEGIPPMQMANNLFVTQMQQRNAEITKALQEMLATTPERIGGGFRPVVGGFQRKVLEGELGRLDKRGEKMSELALTTGADAAKQERSIRGDIEKEAAKGKSPEGQKLEYTQRHNLTKDIEPFVNEARLIERFQKEYPNEIPGIAWGMKPTTITDDQKQAYARLKRIVMVRLRRESGAAISDSELERDSEEVLQAMDEDDVRNMLADRLTEAKDRIDYLSRAPDEREVETVNRAKVAPRAPIADGGAGLPDVTSWDED